MAQLIKACGYTFPDKEPSQTAPIVSAGIMYLTTAHYTVALDGSDCHVIWVSKWSSRDHETFNTHRGAAQGAYARIKVQTDLAGNSCAIPEAI
jgi:alcohol dehydrogenase (cytochrome c)